MKARGPELDFQKPMFKKPGAGAGIYNPGTTMVRWKVETGDSPEAHGPAGLTYTTTNNKKTPLKQHGRQGSALKVILTSIHDSQTVASMHHVHTSARVHTHTSNYVIVCVPLVNKYSM